ncbi:pheromone-regulated membrane protein [Venturia nashicola]|nr:pheromone-regulated membrane protein [Venturia nashicola]
MDSSGKSNSSPDHGRPQNSPIEVSRAEQRLNPQTDMTTADGKKKRVGFSSDITPPSPNTSSSGPKYAGDSSLHLEADTPPVHTPQPLLSINDEEPHRFQRPEIDNETYQQIRLAMSQMNQPHVPKQPKPAIRKPTQPSELELDQLDVAGGSNGTKDISGQQAHDRAQKLAAKVGSYNVSAAASRKNSLDLEEEDMPGRPRPALSRPANASSAINSDDEHDSDEGVLYKGRAVPERRTSSARAHEEAYRLVRTYTHQLPTQHDVDELPLRSGQVTPVEEQEYFEDYVPKPKKYRGSILASLLKLQNSQEHHGDSIPHNTTGWNRSHYRNVSADTASLSGTTPSHTPGHSPTSSGTSTPTSKHGLLSHWPRKAKNRDSMMSISALAGSSSTIALPTKEFGDEVLEKAKAQKNARPGMGRRSKSAELAAVFKRKNKPRIEEEIRITVHIAETLARQKYLIKLCRALMEYGAPTHRLEEYLKASSRVLEISAQWLYIPGCMLISFDDTSTHTTEVKLVRVNQGVDLGKMRDCHQIYKEVVHDQIGVEEATRRLETVVNAKKKFCTWFLVFMYGVAAVGVGPFAFKARLIDLPICFILGVIVGILQIVISPRSDLYANIFEVSAAVITSFLARAFGSIRGPDGTRLFCFSALAQSSIALILPGYTVLCASLELQSRSIVAGSVRMVYAIIYSLFLGFGITIGTVMYGVMDKDASSETTCAKPMGDYWFFFFVPLFTLCLIIINQAKWKQAPIMLFISFTGYLVNYFTSQRFTGNLQVPQALGALTIGIEANLYARIGRSVDNFFVNIWNRRFRPRLYDLRVKLTKSSSTLLQKLGSLEFLPFPETRHSSQKPKLGYGLAAAAMLPAIFVQVPSGLAVSGSLLSGLTSADQIISNTTSTAGSASDISSSSAFNVSYSVIEVAVGITVGLFLSAVIVYPLGKKRSGLFSF